YWGDRYARSLALRSALGGMTCPGRHRWRSRYLGRVYSLGWLRSLCVSLPFTKQGRTRRRSCSVTPWLKCAMLGSSGCLVSTFASVAGRPLWLLPTARFGRTSRRPCFMKTQDSTGCWHWRDHPRRSLNMAISVTVYVLRLQAARVYVPVEEPVIRPNFFPP